MKTKTKHRMWLAILTIGLVAIFATGCKPKEIITERVITKADSTAIWKLQMELSQSELQVSDLKLELNRAKSENTRLNSEVSSKRTEYDTSRPVNPDTGKPPVSSETETHTKSQLEKDIQEKETIIREFRKEVETLTTKNSNLELEVESFKQENSDLKSKTVPAFNLKWFLWGIGIGVGINVAIYLALRRRKII